MYGEVADSWMMSAQFPIANRLEITLMWFLSATFTEQHRMSEADEWREKII